MTIRPRLLVTGGSGLLGRHLRRDPAADAWEVVAPTSAELDLRDRDTVWRSVEEWRPTAIVHTAYRNDEAAAIVDATTHVTEAAAEIGARLVHVSTDALFAGRPEPYTEADPPTPVTDYGRWKADAERIVQSVAPDAAIVRTSLLYAEHEQVGHERVVLDAIEGRTPTSFFTDEFRSPLLVDDLATALLRLARPGEVSGVLHLGGPDVTSRAELAIWAARRHGWDATALRFATIADSGLTRPARVVLDSSLAASLGFTARGPLDLAGRT